LGRLNNVGAVRLDPFPIFIGTGLSNRQVISKGGPNVGKVWRYEELERFKHEMGIWVNGFKWDMWGTGEFDKDLVLRDTIRAKMHFRKWISDLYRPRRTISYFMAVERFSDNIRTHIHFLLNGVGDMRYEEVGQPWWKRFHGYLYIRKYDPDLGANHYITKYVTKELCDWDFDIKKNHQEPLFKAGDVYGKKATRQA
jgi:hypothetical protein